MSSELIDSTIWSAFFFLLIAFCSEARKPVTTIAFFSSEAGLAPVSAWAVSCVAAPVTATEAAPVCCAQAGLAASMVATASGLAAATNREREDSFIIDVIPLSRPQPGT